MKTSTHRNGIAGLPGRAPQGDPASAKRLWLRPKPRYSTRFLYIGILTGLIVLATGSDLAALQKSPVDDPVNAQTTNSTWLAGNGIESTVDSFRSYFENLHRPERDSKLVSDLVQRLASEEFQVRQRATNLLKSVPSLSISELRLLAEEPSLSPEGRYRLLEVIRTKKLQAPAQIQYAIFCDIRDRKMKGLASSIIQSFDSLEMERFVRHAAVQALLATSQMSDLDHLIASLANSNISAEMRAGALRSLNQLSPDTAANKILETTPGLLDQAEGRFGLEVARVLVLNKKIQALDVLFRLLRDKNAAVRGLAFASLVRMTQIELEMDKFPAAKNPGDAVEQIKEWLKQNRNDINYQWYEANPRIGRRLVCQYDADRVIELDEAGKIVWSIPAEKPFACLGLPNGHRFILLYQKGAILEYDGSGRLLKTLDGLPSNISSICRRDNGNLILAAGQNENLIVEIDSDGNQVRSFKIPGKPTSAEIGINGNLVVSLYGSKKIVEIDETGEIVKTIRFSGAPYHATPLVSGNFLVTFAQDRKIIEFNPRGEVVFDITCNKYVYHAQKLDDGTISFADEKGVFRMNRRGTEIVAQTYKTKNRVNFIYSY